MHSVNIYRAQLEELQFSYFIQWDKVEILYSYVCYWKRHLIDFKFWQLQLINNLMQISYRHSLAQVTFWSKLTAFSYISVSLSATKDIKKVIFLD